MPRVFILTPVLLSRSLPVWFNSPDHRKETGRAMDIESVLLLDICSENFSSCGGGVLFGQWGSVPTGLLQDPREMVIRW